MMVTLKVSVFAPSQSRTTLYLNITESNVVKALDFAALKRRSISFFSDEKPESVVWRWARARTRIAKIFRILMRFNIGFLFVLVLLGFGAIFYVGASTSPIIVFVFTVYIISFLLLISL